MEIKNIIFDFGGVLLDLNPQKTFDALSLLMKGDNSVAHTLYQENKTLFDQYEKGEIIMENFLWNIQNMCHVVPDAPELLAAWNAMLLGWNDNKLALLNKLKDRYALYLLSNTNEIHINWIRRDLKRNHRITDFENTFFKKAYYSFEIGMQKPDEEIFEFVTKDASIDPSETLFIDDNLDNINAGKRAGWHVYHLPTNANLDIANIIMSI